jgi:ParB-like chromosome segregation protein Spo0J|tara:strand:- start:22196 stop:22723 length:528 start_codon:yes stop_codon:yes gene_type:complete
MKILNLEIEKLELDGANSRKHSNKNIKAIQKSLETFGQQKPIVINQDNVVIAGNGTLTAAKNLGWEKVSCVKTELDTEKAKAFAIADNKTALLASWDDEQLTQTFRELDADGFDLKTLGFDKKELDEFLNGPEKKTYDEMFVPEFLVLVTCENESDQAEVFDKCQELGFNAKLVS